MFSNQRGEPSLGPTVTSVGDTEVVERPQLEWYPGLERLYCILGGHPNDFTEKDLVEFIVAKRKTFVGNPSESELKPTSYALS